MGLGTVYLSLILLLAAHTAYSDYVALAPSNFRPKWDYRVQITVLNTENSNPVTVRGDILNLKGSSVASGTISLNNGHTAQLQITVPGSLSPDDGTQYTLKLEGTGGLKFTNTTTIQLETQTMVTLLQTDKNLYKPGDTVRFRVVTLDSELKPQKLKRTITVKNPGGSGLKKYMDDGSKAVYVDTFQLMEFPDIGEWKLQVESKEHNMKTEFPFNVKEYVLPKFEVTAEVFPKFVVRNSEVSTATVKVTAKYTYGKGVLGPIEVKIGNVIHRGEITDPTGVGEITINDIAELVRSSGAEINIVVNVSDATQRTYGTSIKWQIKNDPVILEFDKDRSDHVYRPGTPVQVVVKVTTADGRPLTPDGSRLNVTLTDNSIRSNSRSELFDLGNGVRYFTWKLNSIMSTASSLNLEATLTYKGKQYKSWHYLEKYKTVGNATLNAYWTSNSMEMWSNAVFAVDVYQAQDFDLSTLRYMVVSRGNVMINTNAAQGANNQLRITPALCPKADIIVYGLTKVTAASRKPEIIADRLKLDLKGCQEKQVTLSGPGSHQRTGSDVALNFAVSWTEPGKNEMVGEHELFLLAIDKSITLLQDANPDLTPDKVDMALEKFKLAPEDSSGGGSIALGRRKRSIWPGPDRGSAPASTGELFKGVGLQVVSDVRWEDSSSPVWMFDDAMVMRKGGAEMASANEDKKVPVPEVSVTTTVRQDFPETWIWTSAMTDINGRLTRTEKLPDSITTWMVSSFAIRDNTEIAVAADPLEVVAFNPFFVDLNLPYSIRRGEIFTLQATVFNYESSMMEAMVTLEESFGDFEIVGEKAMKVKVKAGTGFSVSFQVKATSIKTITLTVKAEGKTTDIQTPVSYSDTVIRPLIVKPEGKERMGSETMAVILANDKTFEEEEITFQFSKVPIVDGSQRAEARITGDLMGNMLHNIDKLVTQPTGCGEQNMITTVPNIYAMSYLVAVGQTTSQFNRTAKKYMTRGYEKETQQYRFDDGGYSAFGKSDGTQSTWLTAFVVKSFAQAKRFIPVVDEDLLTEDMNYLLSVQTSQGNFEEKGRVIHKEMMGGTATEDGTLSIYVTMCLLEASSRGIPVVPERLTRAIAFVRGKAKELIDRAKGQSRETDMFLASLTAYTLTLSQPVDVDLVMSLMKIVADSLEAPWKKPAHPPISLRAADSHIWPPPKADPSAVETTSYSILTYVGLGKFVEAQNLTKWLVTQQNSFGGYGSTQDTMMALQATSEFAAKSSAYNARSTVTITPLDPPGQPITIPITNSNRRLLTIEKLPDTTRKVKVRVEGDPNSLSVVKLNWYYYTNPEQPPKTVTIDTKTKYIREKEFEFTSCMRLHDKFEYKQMMVMMIDPLSGFGLDNVIEAKTANPCVKRVEVIQENIYFYLDQAMDCCVKYIMSQQNVVDNLQPGNSVVYAYYNADGIRAESSITVDCVQNCPTEPTAHAAPLASMSGLLLTACICLLLSLIVAM